MRKPMLLTHLHPLVLLHCVWSKEEQHRILSLDREGELLPIVARKVQTLVNPRLPEVAVDGVALKRRKRTKETIVALYRLILVVR